MISLLEWLEKHGLSTLHPMLANHDIDLDIMVDLTEADLADIGFTLGHRKRLLRAIATLPAFSQKKQRQRPESTSADPADTEPGIAERRQLTVMFCDLVGSTELSLQLDLEDLREVIRDYQDTISQLLESHHAFIARYMGDGVLVYFGYPVALEDDAYSAVQAGQQILSTFQQSTRFIESGFRVRIGIATGLVVAGDVIGTGVSEEHSVLGQTPNLAARLQGVASPNQMVIDSQTWQLVRRRYTANTLKNLALKGFGEPQTAYEIPVQQPIPLFSLPTDNKHIGRDHELQVLQNMWLTASTNNGQIVLINGDPGIGKSRLIREFQNNIGPSNHHFIRWECSPHATQSSFFAVTSYLEDTFGFTVNDTFETKKNRIINSALSLPLSSKEAQRIAELLWVANPATADGPGSPRERRQEFIRILIEMLTRLAAQKPTVLVIENIHVIDPSTLELLNTLAAHLDTQSLLLLCSCRPEFDPALLTVPSKQTITLSPLSSLECTHLMAEFGSLSDSLAKEILRKADGIPLFIEEITNALFEAASQNISPEGSTNGIPSSLQSLLMAKLDRLGSARELATLAAVISDEIDLELLRKLSNLSDTELQRDLDTLNAAGVLIHDATNAERYRFRHTLFQEIAYQTLLRDNRRALHFKVGEFLRDQQPELANIQPERVARHFNEANAADQAIEFWHRAAMRASGMSANNECTAHINAARPLLAKLSSEERCDYFELELNIVHASVLRGTLGPGATNIAHIYERSLTLCNKLQKKEPLIPVLNGLYLYNLLRTNYSQALEHAHHLLNLANESGDITSRMVGHRALGAVSFNTGDFQQASEHLQKSRLLYDPELHGNSAATIGADHLQAATNFYCVTLTVQGQPQTAFRIHTQDLKRTIEIDHAHNLAQALVFLAFQTSLTAHPKAATYCRQLQELSEQYNFPMMLASAVFFNGRTKYHQGNLMEALADMTAGVKMYQSTGTLNYLPFFYIQIAEVCLALKDFTQAKMQLDLAQDKMEQSGEYWCRAEWLRLKGEYAKLTQSHNAALAYYQQAIDDAESRGAMLWLLRVLQSSATIIKTDQITTDSKIQELLKNWPELSACYSNIN